MSGDSLSPRHLYDCGHCRFAWCCGPLCACFPKIAIKPAPKQRAEYVRRLLVNWNRCKTKAGKERWIELARRAKHRWAKKEGVKIS